MLINTRLKEVLVVAKRAFSISDSSEALFKNLTDEMATEHPILQTLLDRVLNDEEMSSPSEREFIFPRRHILPALFAQGLFPGLFERSHIDDYFWICRKLLCFCSRFSPEDEVQTAKIAIYILQDAEN